MYFDYDDKAVSYLKSCDKKLGEAIDKIGHIEREVRPDLFDALVHSIVGQQISTAAQATIWSRLCDLVGAVTPENILAKTDDELQAVGLSFRKVEYIKSLAEKVNSGEFSLEELYTLSDDEVITRLSSLRGIGVWTAEMLMIFSMQRPDILSFGDLAIIRGLRMLYRHREIDKAKFQKFKKRYSPYASVASLYLWAIAGGAIPELSDPAPKKKK